jgi:hypothetical protein
VRDARVGLIDDGTPVRLVGPAPRNCRVPMSVRLEPAGEPIIGRSRMPSRRRGIMRACVVLARMGYGRFESKQGQPGGDSRRQRRRHNAH